MEHVVKQGECLSSLAARYGLNGWKELHDHPDNAELKKKRPNPNVLFPGDKVVVPDRTDAKNVPVATGSNYAFQVKIQKVRLRIAIVSRSGKPYEGVRFVVNAGGRELPGTTKADGMVEVEVPATETKGRLRVWLRDQGEDALPTIDRDLAIGHIDPIETKSGVRGRLRNLGYGCQVTDESDTTVDSKLLSALISFRANHGLPTIERMTNDNGASRDAQPSADAEPSGDAGAPPEDTEPSGDTGPSADTEPSEEAGSSEDAEASADSGTSEDAQLSADDTPSADTEPSEDAGSSADTGTSEDVQPSADDTPSADTEPSEDAEAPEDAGTSADTESDEAYAERLLDDDFREKLLTIYERSSTS